MAAKSENSMKGIIENVKDTAISRLDDPFLGSFFISLFFLNWRTFVFLFSKEPNLVIDNICTIFEWPLSAGYKESFWGNILCALGMMLFYNYVWRTAKIFLSKVLQFVEEWEKEILVFEEYKKLKVQIDVQEKAFKALDDMKKKEELEREGLYQQEIENIENKRRIELDEVRNIYNQILHENENLKAINQQILHVLNEVEKSEPSLIQYSEVCLKFINERTSEENSFSASSNEGATFEELASPDEDRLKSKLIVPLTYIIANGKHFRNFQKIKLAIEQYL